MSSGYSGYRPSATRDVFAMEPGQSREGQESRFLRMAATVERKPVLSEELALSRASVTASSTSGLRPTDFHVPVQSGRSKTRTLRVPDKPICAETTTREDFTDHREEAEEVAGVPDDALAAAFDDVDTDGSGEIEPKELRVMLRRLLGHTPTALQVSGFLAFFDKNRDGRISRSEFVSGLPRVREFLRRTTHLSGKLASPPQFRLKAPPEVIAGLDVRSRMQEDMGRYGETPWERDMLDKKTGGMSASTKALDAGTARATRHPPGYQGFVPESASEGTRAHVHAFGAGERDVLMSKLNLTETVARRLKGYTGYVPKYGGPKYDHINKPRGQFAPTEQSAADSIVAEYWEARAKSAKKTEE